MSNVYEECAKNVVTITKDYCDQFANIAEALELNKKSDKLTTSGKMDAVDKLREELDTLNQKESDKLREVITTFCNRYQVCKTNEKADAGDIANALKVIEMCGSGLTVDVLKNVAEPLLNDYGSLKMLDGILRTKGCGTEVLDYMMELTGGNYDVLTYESHFEMISTLLNTESIFNGSIPQGSVMGELPGITDGLRYEVFALGDAMMQVGKLHEELKVKYPRMFK